MTTKKPETPNPELLPADNGQSQSFDESLKIAAYGVTGGRKTLQIGHLIERFGAENVGIINCEHGLGTISSLTDKRYIYVAHGLTDLRAAWGWANERFNRPDQWVCVDGGSRALDWINHAIFKGAQDALEGLLDNPQRSMLEPTVRKYASYVSKDFDLNSQQMWWRTGYECSQLLDAFIRIGSNMYWTFWEDQTSISQYVKGAPWIPETPGKGSLAAVKGAFDFIFRLVPDGENVTAIFRNPPGNNANYTKTRDDWRGGVHLPDRIENFNLADLVEIIRPAGNKPATANQPTE